MSQDILVPKRMRSMIRDERWMKDVIVTTVRRTEHIHCKFVTHTFRNDYPSNCGDSRTFEMMSSTLPLVSSVASLLAATQ